MGTCQVCGGIVGLFPKSCQKCGKIACYENGCLSRSSGLCRDCENLTECMHCGAEFHGTPNCCPSCGHNFSKVVEGWKCARCGRFTTEIYRGELCLDCYRRFSAGAYYRGR